MEGEARPGQGVGVAWMARDAWVHVGVCEEGCGAQVRHVEGARCMQKGPGAWRVRAMRAVRLQWAQRHKGMAGMGLGMQESQWRCCELSPGGSERPGGWQHIEKEWRASEGPGCVGGSQGTCLVRKAHVWGMGQPWWSGRTTAWVRAWRPCG